MHDNGVLAVVAVLGEVRQGSAHENTRLSHPGEGGDDGLQQAARDQGDVPRRCRRVQVSTNIGAEVLIEEIFLV